MNQPCGTHENPPQLPTVLTCSQPARAAPQSPVPRAHISSAACLSRPDPNLWANDGPPKPWEMDANTRRRRVRSYLIQAALWAPTTGRKDACVEALMEQQDWDEAAANRWPVQMPSQTTTSWPAIRRRLGNGHQSWAILCRYRCRTLQAEVPDGSDRNTELKQRLQLRRREKFTFSSEDFWDNSKQDDEPENRKPSSRRPKNSVVKELVPSQPEDR